MRNPYLVYLALTIFPTLVSAQTEIVAPLTDAVTDILAQPKLQKTEAAALSLSKLEDQNNENSCAVDIEAEPSCQGFAHALLPEGYKKEGWKTLLEIKYQPMTDGPNRSTAKANLRTYDLSYYRSQNDDYTEISNAEELNTKSQKIVDWYKNSQGVTANVEDIRTQLIINSIKYDKAYAELPDLQSKNDLMFSRVKEFSKSMTDQEYLRFVSAMSGYVDYNKERAAFEQTEKGGKGIVTAFEQITDSKAGICGDIHSMAAKLAEQRGWEAFTVGYALKGNQHVVTAMTNPKDPNNLMLVNYGTYETQNLDDGNWIQPTPSTKMQDLGMQLRIFKNKNTGDANGKMQQIATVPTALGGFMSDLFEKENQIARAMPTNQNYRIEKGGQKTSEESVKLDASGKKLTDKLIGKGFVVYEGETDGAQVYGVAVSREVYKDLYRWDEKENKCVLKKNKYFSVGLATSLVDLKQDMKGGYFYAYLNMKGGQIFHVYQTEHFQFKGLLGYEFEAFTAGSTGDASFATLVGVIADYNKGDTKIHTALTYETNVALKDQNLMTDLGTLGKNVNPFSFNAISLDAKLTQKIGDKTSFVTDNNLTLTRVGGRVMLSTGIITNRTSIMASYQGGVKPLNIGNTLQNINLLQNFNNMDGVRLTVGQGFGSKDRAISGSFSAYAGLSTATEKPMPMAGGSLKIDLNKRKKKSTGN
jgi:hypothetical protein